MTQTRRILLIDDDKSMRKLLPDLFTKFGANYDLMPVKNCDEADVLLVEKQEDFDLILLDIMLPDKSGLQYLKELAERGNKIPIIIITNFGTVENCRLAFLHGVKDFLSKPFHVNNLIFAIEFMFYHKSALSSK